MSSIDRRVLSAPPVIRGMQVLFITEHTKPSQPASRHEFTSSLMITGMVCASTSANHPTLSAFGELPSKAR
ncbi:hypothetical protein [Micromonospora chalcea]